MALIRSIKLQCLFQAILKRHLRRPTQHLIDFAKVGVVIADIDCFPVIGKWNQLVVPAAVDLNQH